MTVSELYRMRDTVEIEDQEMSGRMVVLAGAAVAPFCGGFASGYSSPCLPDMAEDLEVAVSFVRTLVYFVGGTASQNQ